jgi:hypothetical protein
LTQGSFSAPKQRIRKTSEHLSRYYGERLQCDGDVEMKLSFPVAEFAK